MAGFRHVHCSGHSVSVSARVRVMVCFSSQYTADNHSRNCFIMLEYAFAVTTSVCVCFVALPRSLQTTQKLLELINDDDSDLSDLSSDEDVEQSSAASRSQPEQEPPESSCDDSDSDDEPLCNIRNGGGSNRKAEGRVRWSSEKTRTWHW